MLHKIVASFGAGIVGALLLVGTASPAFAKSATSCARRIQKAERNLRDAEHRHGRHSRQAAEKRRALEDARMRCHM